MAVRIAAKQLGWLKMEDYCPRCLWLMQKHPLPEDTIYTSPLSRIFRQFEDFINRSATQGMQQTSQLPSWLSSALRKEFPSMPGVRQMVIPTSWWSLTMGSATLTGKPDVLMQLEDGTWLIADYKLSQPSGRYAPLYETQLNAYAFLAKRLQGLKVSRLALIYFELDERGVAMPTMSGIMTPMKVSVQPVEVWDEEEVIALVEQMAKLLSREQPPEPKPDCSRCGKDLWDWAQALVDWLMLESQ